ncbi:signal peptidase I [Helicobacter didelphidarum]|uniref:Signal peptidase I n=1 Tax=Helicobacter didelphidarum TaxID=2040648 RepID=A0A3D8IRG2_9HELI|nr:signal peptidase I [Helicobacter didelphidarum]RDU67495.1 signal peptidase I [Helicobacter didelphidarum]
MKKIIKKIVDFASSWTGAIIIVLCFVFFVAQGFVIPSRSMVGTLYEGDMMFVKKYAYGIPIPKIPWLEIPIFPDFRGDRHLFEGARPQRGDIVIFNPPGDDKTYYVKRNFAIGGDKVIFARDGMYLRPFQGDSYIDKYFKSYDTREFFGEMYVKEPYSQEFNGIHYGEKDFRITPLSSFYAMQRLAIINTNNTSTTGHGIAMNPQLTDDGEMIFYREIESDSFFMVGDNRDNSGDSRFWGVVDYSRIIGTPWFTYFSITLEDSIEQNAQDPKNRYKVRWNRIFNSIQTLENKATSFEGECRYYSDNPCREAIAY